jgi:hypothetical protein
LSSSALFFYCCISSNFCANSPCLSVFELDSCVLSLFWAAEMKLLSGTGLASTTLGSGLCKINNWTKQDLVCKQARVFTSKQAC